MTGSRRIAWIVVGAMMLGALAVSFWPKGSESLAAHSQRLASEFRCVDCEALSVADSSAASAREQRRDITRRLKRGESDAEIRQAYVNLYGESILLNPATGGIGVVVWALPVIALILGAAGVGFALRRWSRQPRLMPTDAETALVERRRAESGDV